MNLKPFFSCDWGTSSFRLRWIDPGLRVRQEFKNRLGCRTIFEQEREPAARARRFEETLNSALQQFPKNEAPLPLVVSGMATSSIGWRELPYLEEPVKLDGSNLRFEPVMWPAPACVDRTFLISGVALYPEMMRGEETEAIGILASAEAGDGTLVLPGTHSKHLAIRAGRVTGIRTYMTGELFEVLGKHSVLRATVGPEAPDGEPDFTAFAAGVRWAREAGLARGLFRVRTRGVLDKTGAAENRWFLSGLLIGAELAGAFVEGERIVLGAAGAVATLYETALQALGIGGWHTVPEKTMEVAVAAGQALFLASQKAPREN